MGFTNDRFEFTNEIEGNKAKKSWGFDKVWICKKKKKIIFNTLKKHHNLFF